jgi:predicted permease
MFWRRKREDELERELRAHLDLETDDLENRDAARRAFGNLARIKEDVREVWGWTTVERLLQDLKYALRQMRRSPGFSLVAVLTLALGLGATTAMFSIVHGVLLKPMQYREPGRLFVARTLPPARAKLTRDFPVNWMWFERWQKYCRACDGLSLEQFLDVTMLDAYRVDAGEPVKVPALSVSVDFFRTLGVQPSLGRDFIASDLDNPTGSDVIVTDTLWRSRFASDPAILGRWIRLNGEPHRIIGVLPPDFHPLRAEDFGPYSGPADVPLLYRPVERFLFPRRPVGNLNYGALIRLKPGVSREQAISELNALLADIYREYQLETRVTLIPLQQQVTRNAQSALWLLLATVGVVLLIVCVNVGNLMLVRTSGRNREAGVRMALGAGRGRLFALVLEEALVLVTIGGALGLALTSAGLKTFMAVAPSFLPRTGDVQIDWRVMAFAGAAILFSTLLCGVIPAWRLSRTEPMESLRAASAASTETGGRLRLREVMVGFEVALSTILLIVGGLLMISFFRVLHVETGFEVANIVTQDVSFLNPKYARGVRRSFVEDSVAKLAQIPGVDVAAATNHLPLLGEDWVSGLEDPDQPPRSIDQSALANNRFVTPGYFQALGIPLKLGRYLDESDKGKDHAVISERSAEFLWPNQNPIGRRVVGVGSPAPKLEIVGVVGEIRGAGMERPFTMTIYEHYWRMQPIGMSFIVRTRADPATTASAVRSILAHADPEMALPQARTMQQIVGESVAVRKFQMYLAVSFAAAALLLSSLGIYGVISFTVARRTPEIGIRIALGASRVQLVVMVLRDGMLPVLVGLAFGLLGATWIGRLISSQLYGVTPRDPLTMFGVPLILLAVGVCACWLPARRATRIDPLTALRFE